MDIEIEHCRFHIQRHGGWSWSPSSRDWMRAAVEILPQLLLQRLAALLPAQAEGEWDTLRLRIPLSLSRVPLAAWSPSAGQALPEAAQALLGPLMDTAWRDALEAAQSLRASAEAIVSESPSGAPASDPHQSNGSALLALLLDWQRRDQLAQQLHGLDDGVLMTWHKALQQCMDVPPDHRQGRPALVESQQLLQWIAGFLPLSEAPQAVTAVEQMRRRIQAMVLVTARSSLATGAPVVQMLLDRHLPTPAPAAPAPASRMASAAGVTQPAQRRPSGVIDAAASRTDSLPCGEYAITSALPFLMLGPLNRAGYLQALAASLAAAGLEDLLPAFATALAYKVLPPPQRGWQRHPASLRTAALFAGIAEPLEETQLLRLSREAGGHLEAVGRHLSLQVLGACETPRCFLWCSHGQGPARRDILLEAQDLFVVASSAYGEALLFLLGQQPDVHVLIPQAAARPALLQALDQQGLVFITDAPPLRGESWRRLAPVHRWSNGPPGRDAESIALAARLPEVAERADNMMDALIEQRPALALQRDAVLDSQLLLASAFSLGVIAWTLWRQREAIDPLLSLQRFADLDGWLRVEPDRINVRLPLGKRRADLAAHGLLAEVPSVPWLDGRRLTFTGG